MLSSAGIGPLCDAIASSPPLTVDLCLTTPTHYFEFIFHLHDFLHSLKHEEEVQAVLPGHTNSVWARQAKTKIRRNGKKKINLCYQIVCSLTSSPFIISLVQMQANSLPQMLFTNRGVSELHPREDTETSLRLEHKTKM